MLPALGCRP